MTRDEIIQRYGFKPGEREATEREMAERTARAESAEMLERAGRRATDDRQKSLSRDFSIPEPAVEAPASLTDGWRHYIDSTVARAEWRMLKLCLETVGETLAKERGQRLALEAKIDQLTAEVAKLQTRLDQQRGAKRLKVVPPSMIA